MKNISALFLLAFCMGCAFFPGRYSYTERKFVQTEDRFSDGYMHVTFYSRDSVISKTSMVRTGPYQLLFTFFCKEKLSSVELTDIFLSYKGMHIDSLAGGSMNHYSDNAIYTPVTSDSASSGWHMYSFHSKDRHDVDFFSFSVDFEMVIEGGRTSKGSFRFSANQETTTRNVLDDWMTSH